MTYKLNYINIEFFFSLSIHALEAYIALMFQRIQTNVENITVCMSDIEEGNFLF